MSSVGCMFKALLEPKILVPSILVKIFSFEIFSNNLINALATLFSLLKL